MTEMGESESSIALVGGYKLVHDPDGFRLRNNKSVPGEFADVSDIVFNDEETASKVAHILSRFSAKGSSGHKSFIRFGERLEVGVNGGESPSCAFYRYSPEKGREAIPFFETKSRAGMAAALKPYIGKQK